LLPTYFELCHFWSSSFLYCLFNSCLVLCCCSWSFIACLLALNSILCHHSCSFVACLLWVQSFVVTPIPPQLTCTSSSILCCCSSSISCLLQTQSAFFKLCKVF
jgi:hypothetical protein